MYGRDRTRYLVRKRDKFICQRCGSKRTPAMSERLNKKQFDVHHLRGNCGKMSKKYDRVRDMAGMITYCHKCHLSLHSVRKKMKLAAAGKYVSPNRRKNEK